MFGFILAHSFKQMQKLVPVESGREDCQRSLMKKNILRKLTSSRKCLFVTERSGNFLLRLCSPNQTTPDLRFHARYSQEGKSLRALESRPFAVVLSDVVFFTIETAAENQYLRLGFSGQAQMLRALGTRFRCPGIEAASEDRLMVIATLLSMSFSTTIELMGAGRVRAGVTTSSALREYLRDWETWPNGAAVVDDWSSRTLGPAPRSTSSPPRPPLPPPAVLPSAPPSASPAPEDDSKYAAVVRAIVEGTVTESSSGHLILPLGMRWPIATNNILFVRRFYAPLFESVMKRCRPSDKSNRHRFIVTGQPGIGKSVFGWYLIYRLLMDTSDRRTIVYASSSVGVFVVIGPHRTVQTLPLDKLSEFCSRLREDDAVLIADSLLPPVADCPTVVLSSPGVLGVPGANDKLNNFPQRLFMPLPTEEEVLLMRREAFPDVAEAGVRLRMSLWGPIPRHVLVYEKALEHSMMWDAIKDVPAAKIERRFRVSSTGDADTSRDAPHRIVHQRCAGQADPHLAVDDEMFYARGPARFASLPIARWAIERFAIEKQWALARLVCDSKAISSLGAVRGLGFENLAKTILAEGGEFEARSLHGEGVRTVRLPAAKAIVWDGLAALHRLQRTPALLLPKRSNQAGLDGLLWDTDSGRHWPFDATVADRHSIHHRGVRQAMETLGLDLTSGPDDIILNYYWVVPENESREITSPQGASRGTREDRVARALRQWVLVIPDEKLLNTAVEAVKHRASGVASAQALLHQIQEFGRAEADEGH